MARGIDTRAFTLGPISRQVKSRASRKQWKKIVKTAHSRGFQVEDFLNQSIPNALKARTRRSLQSQANSTMAAAFAPAEKEIGLEEERAKAIDSKRARDNQYYLDWLNAKSGQLNAHAVAANAKLREAAKETFDTTATTAAGLRDQIAQSVMTAPGVISDPSQSTTLNQQVPNQAAALVQQAAATRDATDRQISSQESTQAGYDASNFAFIAAMEARRQGDTWNRLADLGDERQKLQLTKAAESAKEVARLLDEERGKAQVNQENAIVAERLGVDMAELAFDEKQARTKNRLDRDKLAETIRHNKATIRNRKANQDIRNALEQAKIDIAENRLDLDWWKAKHGNKKKGDSKAPSAKSKDPQARFDYGYALVATSRRPGTPGSGNKPGKPGKAYDPTFVAKNLRLVENQLVAQGLTRRMAKAIITSFISNGRDRNKDPGDYRDYLPGEDRPT